MKHIFLFSAFVTISTAVFAADEINNSSPQPAFPVEYVNSCKGLSEKDGCQIHDKANNLVTGICKTKAITNDNFELVCVPDQSKNPSLDSDAAIGSDQDTHQHKHKHH